MFSCQHCAHCATACLCCQESTRMWATGAGKRATLSHSVFQQGHVGQWHLWVWGPSGQEVPSQAKWAGLVSPSTQPAWTPSAAAWGPQPPTQSQCTQKRLMLLFTPTRPPLPVPQMMSPPEAPVPSTLLHSRATFQTTEPMKCCCCPPCCQKDISGTCHGKPIHLFPGGGRAHLVPPALLLFLALGQ